MREAKAGPADARRLDLDTTEHLIKSVVDGGVRTGPGHDATHCFLETFLDGRDAFGANVYAQAWPGDISGSSPLPLPSARFAPGFIQPHLVGE